VRGEKGFALVLVLVVTALMVAVLAELIHQVYVDTTISRGFRDGQQASLLAESGITGGKKLLQLTMPSNYSSLADKWATPFKMDDETGKIEITITEESGKICLNNIAPGNKDDLTLKALKLLGDRLNLDKQIWSALVDWLDSDDEHQGSGGAESSYYMSLKPPYRARNGKLATLAELTLVKGFTPEVVSKLAPFVTVYSAPPGSLTLVNINTAPKEVIASLDESINDQIAERIMEKRRLTPFKQIGDLSTIQGGGTISQTLTANAGVQGKVFRIISIAQVKDAARTVEAVVWLGGEVLSWQEY
jgi:general secretion pathway protein K